MATPVMTALRTAVRNTLINDGLINGLLGGPRVYHRFVRKRVEVPEITYFDTTFHPTAVIPRIETRWQIDVWTRILDDCEAIADQVTKLLDLYEAADAGNPGLHVLTGEATIALMRLETELDDMAQEAPEIARKTLIFNMIAFPQAA